jgi:glycosyltransferase involved in cell wall biosynthesis
LLVLRYFYCPSQSIGGAERQALRLAKKLQEKDVSLTVATGLWDWGQPRRQIIQGVPVHRHFTAWGMFNIRGLRKFGQYFYLLSLFLYLIWHRNKYDVVHCHSAMFGASAVVLAGKLLHKPTLVRSMASGAWGDLKMMRKDQGIWGAGWMSSKIKQADAIVALNNQVVQEMKEIGVAPEKIFHIPNGIDVKPDNDARSYALGNPIVISFVGRLHPQKNVTTLLQAFKVVLDEKPRLPWHLKLAGTGPLEHKLRALADELAIGQRVEFLGHVNDIDALLDRSDVFVLPSKSEGISNALLEAMAHGLPCVVTDIPGNHDLIRDGENGVTVKTDDVQGLAQAILRLADDVGFRQRVGQRAYQTAKAQYALTRVADQYIQLYQTLLHRQPGPESSSTLPSELGYTHSTDVSDSSS